jgi:hypothetical protein
MCLYNVFETLGYNILKVDNTFKVKEIKEGNILFVKILDHIPFENFEREKSILILTLMYFKTNI